MCINGLFATLLTRFTYFYACTYVCVYTDVFHLVERETVTNEGFLLRRLFVNLFRYPPRAELIVATFRRDQGYPLSTL